MFICIVAYSSCRLTIFIKVNYISVLHLQRENRKNEVYNSIESCVIKLNNFGIDSSFILVKLSIKRNCKLVSLEKYF